MVCYQCNNDLSRSDIVARSNEIRFNCYDSSKQVVRCNNCGLIQLAPQWSDKELDVIYNKYNQKPDFAGQKNVSKRISKYIGRYMNKKNSILEVGCGCGDNVKYYRKKGFNICGLDKDKSVEDKENSVFHGDIYDETIRSKYDFIYGLHILEHMKDPVKFVDRLKNLLNSKGTILLEFPSAEDPLLTVYKIKEFRLFYYRPDHHFFYTPGSLSDILSKNNIRDYTVKRMQNYGLVNHLNWLVRRKPTNLKINIPVIDNIYKWILTNMLKKSDTILLTIKRGH